MASAVNRLQIPEKGFPAIAQLVDLPSATLSKLAEVADASNQVSLNLGDTIRQLAEKLDIDQRRAMAICGLLMSLNQIRLERDSLPFDFVEELDLAINDQASEKWKDDFSEKWKAAKPTLPLLFHPDNLFSIARKTQELWANRPAIVQTIKILSDLRPVYNEAATKSLALVLTNTLVVEYVDKSANDIRTLHLSLNQDDLSAIEAELDRARKKNETITADASQWGIDILVFGGN